MQYSLYLVNTFLPIVRTIGGWLSEREALFLHLVAQEKTPKGEVVEIGSWHGKSTIALAMGLVAGGTGKVYAIDPHEGLIQIGTKKETPTKDIFLANLKRAKIAHKVIPVVATSEKAAKNWDKPIRLLFIDGLHDYQHAKQDYELWSPYVVPGGTVAFHDAFCGIAGVDRAVKETILAGDYIELGVQGSIMHAKKGKPTSLQAHLISAKDRLLIGFGVWVHHLLLPRTIKFTITHRVIRFFLLTKYDRAMLGGVRT